MWSVRSRLGSKLPRSQICSFYHPFHHGRSRECNRKKDWVHSVCRCDDVTCVAFQLRRVANFDSSVLKLNTWIHPYLNIAIGTYLLSSLLQLGEYFWQVVGHRNCQSSHPRSLKQFRPIACPYFRPILTNWWSNSLHIRLCFSSSDGAFWCLP